MTVKPEILIKLKKLLIFTAALAGMVFLLDRIFPLPELRPYSKIVYTEDGAILNAYLSADDKWRLRTSLDEVSPKLIQAVISKEDNYFYWHNGVNPVAVARAFYQNLTEGKVVSGASTITMQVARMLEPADRTVINKFLEMLRAFQLELHYSKDEILEIYLSRLPLGGNIEGIKSGALIYFNKAPENLSLAEAAALSIIPNDPNKYRIDESTAALKKKRNALLERFKADGVFSDQEIDQAMQEELISSRYKISPIAPHFALKMTTGNDRDKIYTTLNSNIHKTCAGLLKKYVQRNRSLGISNGSVIVIDNNNSEVIAYCGSSDFQDELNDGQVDGITAVRSPGSTLKPFLYASAFDRGSLTPKMKLLDVPTEYAGYEPQNYSLDYLGMVTADFALKHSLNVPAVRMLYDHSFSRFIETLENCGFGSISKDKEKLGLSVILGGCGATLEELTRAYSLFAREGQLHPLNYFADDEGAAKQIFSPATAYLIAEILSDNARPDFPHSLLDQTALPKIAWKTGTSWGKRDAWAIGFNPDYTVGVWTGNFDGKGSPHLSGAEMSVPLLFEIFNALPKGEKDWFDQPEELKKRAVCEITGLLPSENCKKLTNDFYIKNISHKNVCDLLQPVLTDSSGTMQYCSECRPDSGAVLRNYPEFEPEYALWQGNAGYDISSPPPHNPECPARYSGSGPKIVSPSANYEYFLNEDGGKQLMLQAASAPGVEYLHWYMNGRYIGRSAPAGKLFVRPESGAAEITCMDARGRKSKIKVEVRYY